MKERDGMLFAKKNFITVRELDCVFFVLLQRRL